MSIRLNERDLTEITNSGPVSEKIRKILINGERSDRIEILQTLYASKNMQYLELIREIMLFDNDAVIRSLCFHIIATFGNREDVEDLIEVIVLEQDEAIRDSLIDMFKRYLKKHNIEIKNIPQIPLSQKSDISTENDNQEHDIEVNRNLSISEDPAKMKLLEYIYEMPPEIPISAHRIAQILRIDFNSLTTYLREFINNNPDAGKYLEFEQVFIKKEQTVRKLIDSSAIRSTICSNCSQSTNKHPCEHCGKGDQCVTCRLSLGADEDSLQCPKCNALSHRNHILEWLKIKGQCPNCKSSLKQKELI